MAKKSEKSLTLGAICGKIIECDVWHTMKREVAAWKMQVFPRRLSDF